MTRIYALSDGDAETLLGARWRWATEDDLPAPMRVSPVDGRHTDYTWLAACPECPWCYWAVRRSLADLHAREHEHACPARRIRVIA